MRFVPKSFAGQLTLLLLLALAVAQGVAVALFAWERMEALRDAHRENAVQRTATVARLLADTPPALHESVIAAASTGIVRFSLAPEPLVGETGTGEGAAAIAGELSAALDAGPERVRVAPLWTRYLDDDDDHDHDRDHDDDDEDHDHDHGHRELDWFTASIGLADGGWLNVAVGPPPGAPAWGAAFVAVFLLSALGIAAVAVLTGRRLATPMRGLASAAGRLGRGEAVEDLPEAGPAETRETVRAFNLMRARLDRYVSDRTAMLAAVSHDLKTPITSLRLHAEFVEDAETRTKILAALDEMQRMTGDALAFIREDNRELVEHEGLRPGLPAQRRLDPRRELGRRERLDEVVGGAPLQRPGDGLVAPVGRDEDDRDVGQLGDGLHELDAVGARQHQVEQHQAGALGPDDPGQVFGVAGRERRVAGTGERVADEA
jgi:hypothetical protein